MTQLPGDSVEPPYLTIDRAQTCPFDPPKGFTEAAAAGDITPIDFHAGHTGWLVTGYEVAKEVLVDRRFSVRPDLAHSPGASALPNFVAPGLFHQIDPPEHTRLRRSVTNEFTPAAMERLRPFADSVATACLDELEAKGSGADLVHHVAFPFPLLIISEFLGLPVAMRDLFVSKAREVVVKDSPATKRTSALESISRLLEGLLSMKVLDPGDDLLSRLACRDDLDEGEKVGVAAQVLVAGSMVPASMLGFGLYVLLSEEGRLAHFAQGKEAAAAGVEELLRYLSFESQPRIRVATEDVSVGDVDVREGQMVAVAIDSGNRDARRYPAPDDLDLGRDASGHLAFGWGVHQCLGQNLARMELTCMLTALARRFPGMRLVDDDSVTLKEDGITRAVGRLSVTW